MSNPLALMVSIVVYIAVFGGLFFVTIGTILLPYYKKYHPTFPELYTDGRALPKMFLPPVLNLALFLFAGACFTAAQIYFFNFIATTETVAGVKGVGVYPTDNMVMPVYYSGMIIGILCYVMYAATIGALYAYFGRAPPKYNKLIALVCAVIQEFLALACMGLFWASYSFEGDSGLFSKGSRWIPGVGSTVWVIYGLYVIGVIVYLQCFK